MDQQELERIQADARAIQAMLETLPSAGEHGSSIVRAAQDAGGRILDCCERLSKRMRPAPSAPDQDSSPYRKADQLEQSRRAGEHVVPFGKHKGKALKAVPYSYLRWLMGVRQSGREFENVPMDKHGWIITHHADTIAQVKAFLTWRCWACGSTDTRFEFSRLCPECWHECE